MTFKGVALAGIAAVTLSLSAGVAGAQVLQDWMSDDVADAWADDYKGQGVSVTVIDDFTSNDRFRGNLGEGSKKWTHGMWTGRQIMLLAPEADFYAKNFTSNSTVQLHSGLDVLNLSYGMYIPKRFPTGAIPWGAREESIIEYAQTGQAVVVKAAGNDAVAIGDAVGGSIDQLNMALVGGESTLFVGALEHNGTVDNPAYLADYSNYAGDNAEVQENFLVVGVEGDITGLYGTSFAAPVVSGYAAILGSKFTTATPEDITNRLLDTARTDTVADYDVAVHGQGEASLSRALAPNTIN